MTKKEKIVFIINELQEEYSNKKILVILDNNRIDF